MVASFPGVQYGQLFYRRCDNLKNLALKTSCGNFDSMVTLTTPVKQDLQWWIDHIENQNKHIVEKTHDIVIETDASNTGWGACISNDRIKSTGGLWTKTETKEHINYKEILAAWLAIQCYANTFKHSHIKILTDNTTAVAYINKLGGRKDKCNAVTRDMWEWCYKNKNWLTAAHLPGIKNVIADRESRSTHDNMEWELDSDSFSYICSRYGVPDIDLFASRLNHKVDDYFSYKPDPGAIAINAMTEFWGDKYLYAFPPFNMVGRVLKKIEQEHCTGIVIVPKWTTQSWWPKFTQLCSEIIVLCRERGKPLLQHPRRQECDLPKMQMVAGRILRSNSTKTQGSRNNP
jgi:hypothetical protein